jgi:hypothetical protein
MGWDNGAITYKGKDTGLTEYTGSTATAEMGSGGLTYNFSLDTDCASVVNITPNNQGVEEADMDKYKGMYYYQEYLGTKFTGAIEVADNAYSVCQVYLEGLNAELVAKYVKEYLDSFYMTNGSFYVDFGSFTFGTGYDQIKLTSSGASITGTIKVTQDTKGATTPYTFTQGDKTYNMNMTSTDKYDYYEYDGFLIQIAKGISIEEYITIN